MKIDYAHIFSGFEPNTIAACGLSYGYMRFLFQLASDYHSFWLNGERVSLTDGENQLIELGTAVLADMMINGCQGASPMLKVVDWVTLGQTQPTAGNSAILGLTGYTDTNYFTVFNQLKCVTAGNYLVHVTARPRVDQPYLTVPTAWELRCLYNLVQAYESKAVYVPPNLSVTADLLFSVNMAVNDQLLFHVYNGSSEGTMYFFEGKRLEIWAI